MAIAPGPGELPAPSAVLIVLDGWGLEADGPGNAVSQADTPVFDELWSQYPYTQLIAGGAPSGCPGPDGQLRGGSPQPRRRRRGQAGPDPDRRGGRGRRAVGQRGAPPGVLGRGPRAPDRTGLRWRRSLGLEPSPGADPDGRRTGRPGSGPARVHRRARHAADIGRRVPGDGRALDQGRRSRADRLGSRPLLRDGPRQALGPHPARLRPARARHRRALSGHRSAGSPRRLRARRDRRVHQAGAGRRGGPDPPRCLGDRLRLQARPDA